MLFNRLYASGFRIGALMLCALALAGAARGAVRQSNGTGGGNWGTASTWQGGVVPAAGDDVIILAGDAVNMNVNATCASLAIQGTLNANTNTRTITVSGSLTMSGAGAITGGAASRVIAVNGAFAVPVGAACSMAAIQLSVAGPSTIAGGLTFTSGTATRAFDGPATITGSLSFNAGATASFNGDTHLQGGAVTFAGAGTWQVNGALTTSSGATVSGGGVASLVNAAGGLLAQAGSSSAFTGIQLTVTGDARFEGDAAIGAGTWIFNDAVRIQGNGVLDASTGAPTLRMRGDWLNTSAAPDAFVEGTASICEFVGATGTQTILRSADPERFHRVIFNSASAAVPAIVLGCSLEIAHDFDHLNGVTDLAGRSIRLLGAGTGAQHDLSGGALISSAAGALLYAEDPARAYQLVMSNYRVGSADMPVAINATCGRIRITGTRQWGPASFTKTLNTDDVFGGGNVYHGPVTFTAAPTASRWRMGNAAAVADTFHNATFNAFALGGSNNNFIVCANSAGNAFYGTTIFRSTTNGGLFITRNNGAGVGSATFHGPVVATVELTGSIGFADASAGNPTTNIFHGTVQANSVAGSTGNIFFGNNEYSTVVLSPSASFIPGTLTGQTSIYLRNVAQSGPLPQRIIGASNSRIYCGGATYPAAFEGPVVFTADTVGIYSSAFSGDAAITGNSQLFLTANTFSGLDNLFVKRGAANSACVGGNSFGVADGTTTFRNEGAGYFRLANSAADAHRGTVRYVQSGAGALHPAYGADCTYEGDISTVGTAAQVQFAVGAGRVTLSGIDQAIHGHVALPPLFYRLTCAQSGILTLNVPATVRNDLVLSNGAVNLNGRELTLGVATGTPGTLTRSAGHLYGGSFRRWFPTAAVTLGAVNGLFPMGTADGAYRPFWFGSTANLTAGGTLAVTHAPTVAGSFHITPFMDASWGFNVLAVSNAVWTTSVANGFSINGTTARIRYGGEGFSPFNLSDVNATRSAGAVGTHAASSSFGAPLEVSRTGLSNALIAQAWRIGTRDPWSSPLPVELLRFTAAADAGKVHCAWATASERDAAHFLIERSRDGSAYEEVAMVQATGNSQQLIEYVATDPAPYPGLSYYRLTQVDADGAQERFAAVAVLVEQLGTDLVVFPNPSAGRGLHLMAEPEAQLRIAVLGSDGRLLMSMAARAAADGRCPVDATGLAAGCYILQAEANGRLRSTRLVLE